MEKEIGIINLILAVLLVILIILNVNEIVSNSVWFVFDIIVLIMLAISGYILIKK